MGMVTNLALGTTMQSKAMKGAADARDLGFRNAVNTYKEVPGEYKPYMDFGKEQLSAVQQLFGDPSSIKGLPGYQFRYEQGQQAVETGAASKGKLFSGQTLEELVRYGQGFASEEYDKEVSRRMAGVNVGMQATQGYDAANLNLADIYAGQGQAAARYYEDKSKYIAGHEQAGREMFSSWFGGNGVAGSMVSGKAGG